MSSTPPEPLFPPTSSAAGFVFVSGQASVDSSGIVHGTFSEEMDRSMENLRSALAGSGLTLRDIVKVTAYVDDPEDLTEYNRRYPEYFPSDRPARTTLVGCLGGVVKFEIDAIAHPQRGSRTGSDASSHVEERPR